VHNTKQPFSIESELTGFDNTKGSQKGSLLTYQWTLPSGISESNVIGDT